MTPQKDGHYSARKRLGTVFASAFGIENRERPERKNMATESTKMTVARALKEKERIARKLAKAKELFASSNCVRADEVDNFNATHFVEMFA